MREDHNDLRSQPAAVRAPDSGGVPLAQVSDGNQQPDSAGLGLLPERGGGGTDASAGAASPIPFKYDAGKESRPELIPAPLIWCLGVHYARGAEKYEDEGWRKRADKWDRTVAALERHLLLWRMGEEYDMGTPEDPGTGSHHLICVMWNAGTLFMLWLGGLGTDSRVDRDACNLRHRMYQPNPRPKKKS